MMTFKQKFDYLLKTYSAALCVQAVIFGIAHIIYNSGITSGFFPMMLLIGWIPLAVALFAPSANVLTTPRQYYENMVLILELGVAMFILLIDTACFGFAVHAGEGALMFFFGIGAVFIIRVMVHLTKNQMRSLGV